MIFDCFPIHDELDMLECRLRELESVPNLVHIAVEADVTHQDSAKPYYLSESVSRFEPWADRLFVVRATGLPTIEDDPDPWAREHAQREYIADGLRAMNAADTDIVMQSDLDEIPAPLVVRNVRPNGMLALEQRLYCFAVDWLHPDPWRGTVVTTASVLGRLGRRPFGYMRDARNVAPALRNGGWHMSWLGGQQAALRKLDAFCHPEIAERTEEGLEQDYYLNQGYHVDGKKLIPVDVDATWPKYVYERQCPDVWFRPR